MEQYFILARSVTYAQRMKRVLDRTGSRCQIFRAPRELAGTGCAYTVRVTASDLTPALIALHRESLDPVQIFIYQGGTFREVRT